MMPPKKRTDQSKRTTSTSSTTSTSHASDPHHRLRHTGPSISTRPSVNVAPSKPPARTHREPTPESSPTHDASQREEKPPAEVSPPGARTPFTKFLYALTFALLLLLGWYIYGMLALLEKLKEEVGWWGIITGDYSGGMLQWEPMTRPGAASEGSPGSGVEPSGRQGGQTGTAKGGELEGSLNALADALGISPMQIASAVKPLIPQARLSSIVWKTEGTGDSEAIRILFEDTLRNDWDGTGTTRIVEESAGRSGRGAAEENAPEGDKVRRTS